MSMPKSDQKDNVAHRPSRQLHASRPTSRPPVAVVYMQQAFLSHEVGPSSIQTAVSYDMRGNGELEAPTGISEAGNVVLSGFP